MPVTTTTYKNFTLIEDPASPGNPDATLTGAGGDLIQDNFKTAADYISDLVYSSGLFNSHTVNTSPHGAVSTNTPSTIVLRDSRGVVAASGISLDGVEYTKNNFKTLAIFTAFDNEPPSASYATLDTRNSHPVLDFDASADEFAVFRGILPRSYNNSGVTVILHWMATSATSGACRWAAQWERCNTDLDADSFATAQSAGTTTNGTAGIINTTSINFANGSEMDSVAIGEMYRLKVFRDADGTSGTDDMTGDAELVAIEIKEQ